MTHFFRTIGLACLVLSLSACSFTTNIKFGSSKSSPAGEITLNAVEKQIDRIRGKWNGHDAEGLGEEYTADGLSILGSQDLALIGRDAIVENFGAVFGEGSPFKGATANITTEYVKDLGNGYAVSDGTFEVFGSDGASMMIGKWGDVMKATAEGPRMLQEAVFATLTEADNITPPAGDNAHAGLKSVTNDPAMMEIVKSFEENNNQSSLVCKVRLKSAVDTVKRLLATSGGGSMTSKWVASVTVCEESANRHEHVGESQCESVRAGGYSTRVRGGQ